MVTAEGRKKYSLCEKEKLCLHHLKHDGKYCHLCSSCVLITHCDMYCPRCLEDCGPNADALLKCSTCLRSNSTVSNPNAEVYPGRRVHSTLVLPWHSEPCESMLFRLNSLPSTNTNSKTPPVLLPPTPPAVESPQTIPPRSCFRRQSSGISFGALPVVPELNYPELCEFHLCPSPCSYFYSADSALVFIPAFVPGPSGNGAKCLPY